MAAASFAIFFKDASSHPALINILLQKQVINLRLPDPLRVTGKSRVFRVSIVVAL